MARARGAVCQRTPVADATAATSLSVACPPALAWHHRPSPPTFSPV